MLPSNICRTCAVQNNNLLPLSTSLGKHTNKSFYDVLQELTQIDPLLENADDNLPQHLCTDCLERLENAYAFVEQARKVNGELLVRLRECLEESPIDIPQQPIKTEIDIDEEQRDFTDSGDPQRSSDVDLESAGVCSVEFKWTPESDALSNEEDEDVDKQQAYILRRSSRKVKQQPDSEEEEGEGGNPSPNKRRRGRPPGLAKSQSKNAEGRHVCEVCGKTFSWYRDMKRHARIHYEKAAFVCDTCGKGFLRKDKYTFHLRSHEKREAKCQALQLKNEWRYAERLYNSGRLKRMQCKLCGLKCQRLQELRSHMESHTRTDSLFSLRADSDVVKEHFSRVPLELEKIKEQVCSEIAAGQLEKYSCVVNFHGYELCLSDSDDEPAGGEPPYHCDLCNLSYTRKYRLMRHTLEEHSQSPIARRCSLCKVGFVCAKLFKQHQRTQCQSKVKRYRCRKCPGKFMWLENLERHACSHRREEQSYRQIICCLCDAQLPSLRQLRTHLATHRHGLSGIDPEQKSAFFRSYYPNGLGCSLSDLSSRIAAEYEAQDFGRYYNACTGSGQELDLFDSDTEESDADKIEGRTKPSHTCLLCGETADRLHKLLQHQRRLHSEEGTTYPCSCEECGAGFVSDPLLQQHRRRSCAKKHSKYHCQHCNLHFVWQSNYEQHLRLYHNKQDHDQEHSEDCQKSRTHKSSPAELQCNECEKVFIWHKDLTRHKRMHRPTSAAQFECAFCDRKFHRKDGLKSHMRVHNEQEQEAAVSEEQPPTNSIQRITREQLSQLCRPNGCKLIQCMICLSRHSKIADLRTHLGSHQYGVSFTQERDIASASCSLYPELVTAMDQQELVERIMSDVASGVELERFVSITNEAGIELSLESSETETDSEQEDDKSCEEADQQRYVCNICQLEVRRRHKLYTHQLEQHQWEEAPLECAHCQARFVSEALLEHHYRSLCRNPQKRFQCRKCPLRFRWRENLKLHVSASHQQKEVPPAGEESSIQLEFELQCGECKRSFKMQKDLTRHTLMHAQESSIYRCRWCARRFYRKANLLQHIERHGIGASQLSYAEALLDAYSHANGQKCVECKVCSLSFSSIAALRVHLGSHHELTSLQNYSITNQMGFELDLNDSETDEGESKPPGTPAFYTCGMCQLRCVRKYELHQHQQAMHRLEKIPDGCDRCIFKSVSPDLIAHHKRVQCHNQEKQFTCANCGYKFMWESNLLLHVQLQHGKTEEQEEHPPQEETTEQKTVCQIFQCGLCPRKYNRKDRLTAHVKKFHNPVVGTPSATRPPPIRPASPKEPKRFLCAFCGKAVSSSSNLIIHMRRHTGEKPFKCDYCEMAFPRSSDLQCHRRTHTGERPHICTVCQKGFARSYKLQQHMRIHNGERPYKCTYCEKSFTQSNDLTLHIRRHTGERPYQCGVCGERFIQGTALKNHRLQQGHYDEASQEGAESSRRTVLEQFTV